MMTQDKIHKIWLVFGVILGYLAALFLGLELLLKKQGESLCHTATCGIVGHYTRIGEMGMTGMGAQFFLVLATLLVFVYRYPRSRWLQTLVWWLLVGAMAFEGVLLGFQFFSLQSLCLLCGLVFIAVAVLLGLFTLATRKIRLGTFGLAVWLAGLAGMFVLNVVPGLGKTELGLDPVYSMAGFHDRQNPAPRMTLIVSLHCPHCAKVVTSLALKRKTLDDQTLWAIGFTDVANEDLKKIALFGHAAPKADNPFALLLAVKQGNLGKDKDFQVDEVQLDAIRRQVLHTKGYLKVNGLSGVPVLVADEDGSHLHLLVGATSILEYLGIAQ